MTNRKPDGPSPEPPLHELRFHLGEARGETASARVNLFHAPPPGTDVVVLHAVHAAADSAFGHIDHAAHDHIRRAVLVAEAMARGEPPPAEGNDRPDSPEDEELEQRRQTAYAAREPEELGRSLQTWMNEALIGVDTAIGLLDAAEQAASGTTPDAAVAAARLSEAHHVLGEDVFVFISRSASDSV